MGPISTINGLSWRWTTLRQPYNDSCGNVIGRYAARTVVLLMGRPCSASLLVLGHLFSLESPRHVFVRLCHNCLTVFKL